MKSLLSTKSLFTFVALALAGLQAGCAADATAESREGGEQVESAEDGLTRAQCRGAVGETDQRCRVEGVVESVFIGEMDPYVVGDVCVTFVKVGSKRYGLVQEMDDACPDADHFAGGAVKVSFSKGALDLASRSRAKVLKEYDGNATYYEFTGSLREANQSGLAAFDALSDSDKVDTLYETTQGGEWALLRAGFTKKSIRIVDTQTGAAKARALAAYGELAPYSYSNGGGQPDVFAIQKAGVTYAYGMEASGRSYGNWGALLVFDREWNELATFSWAD